MYTNKWNFNLFNCLVNLFVFLFILRLDFILGCDFWLFLLLLLFQCIYLFFIKKRLIEGTSNIENTVNNTVEGIVLKKAEKVDKPDSEPDIDKEKLEDQENFDIESKAKNKEDEANKKLVKGGLIPS